MHYTVQARFIPNTATDFLRKLTDGTIENQQPDGKGIVASMKRAVIDEKSVVRWSEVCYCPTPRQHERTTVYDDHFTDIETVEVSDYVEFEGKALMDCMEQLARNN